MYLVGISFFRLNEVLYFLSANAFITKGESESLFPDRTVKHNGASCAASLEVLLILIIICPGCLTLFTFSYVRIYFFLFFQKLPGNSNQVNMLAKAC